MISCIDPRNHATIGPGHQPTDPPQFHIILESNQGSRCRDDDRNIPEMIHKNHFLGELLDCTFNGFTASPILAIKKTTGKSVALQLKYFLVENLCPNGGKKTQSARRGFEVRRPCVVVKYLKGFLSMIT